MKRRYYGKERGIPDYRIVEEKEKELQKEERRVKIESSTYNK